MSQVEETAEQKIARLEKENSQHLKDKEIAQDVISSHKKEIEELKANPTVVDRGRVVHTHNKKKYILLFPVIVSDNTEVTDAILSKDSKYLKELIETDSGALEEVK